MSFKAKIRFCTFYTIVFRVLKSINLLWCIKAKNGRLFSCTKKTLVYSFVEKNALEFWLVTLALTCGFTKMKTVYLLIVFRPFFVSIVLKITVIINSLQVLRVKKR